MACAILPASSCRRPGPSRATCACSPGLVDLLRLVPRNTWADKDEFEQTARRLAKMFHANFEYYAAGVSPEIAGAGPIDVGDVDLGNFKLSKPGEG